MKILKNVALKPYATLAIGGPADYFVEAKSQKEIIRAVSWAKKNQLDWFILGNGSNILIGDKGFRGLVIRVQNSKFKIQNSKIQAEAGLSLLKLLNICQKNSLAGLEFLAGIPGTVGGAIKGNAGTKENFIGQKVEKVTVLGKEGRVYTLKRSECNFGYRDSRFSHNNEVILSVLFNLKKSSPQIISQKIKKFFLKRKAQPKGKSAGSIFKNPALAPAGYLIEKAGLKGKKVGGAKISSQHANWIINFNQATAKDVLSLIKLVKQKIKKDFKIVLKEEIDLKGEF